MNYRIRHFWGFAIILLASASICRSDEAKMITPESAKDYVGQEVTIEFLVNATKQLDEKGCGFLNSARDPADPNDFTLFITHQAFEKLDSNATANLITTYFLCRIQATGKIQQFNRKREIVIDSPDQIKILQRPKEIKLDEAKDNVGQPVVVEFVIQASHEEPGKYCFLNSEKDYTNPQVFCVFIGLKGMERFAANAVTRHPADDLLHKKVRVLGLMKLRNQKPEIVVDSPDCIKVVDE